MWRTMNAGKMLVYSGDEGFIRLCKAEGAYAVVTPPLTGTTWVFQAIDPKPDTTVLLNLALAKLQESVGETWFVSPAEQVRAVIPSVMLHAWGVWKAAHSELNWTGDLLKVV